MMFSRRSIGRARRCAKQWVELLTAVALLALAGCAPRATVVEGLPRSEPVVRVGLQVDAAEVTASSSSGMEIVDPASGRRLQQVRGGDAVRVRSAGDDRLIFVIGGREKPTNASSLVLRPQRGGTVSHGGREYRGALLVRSTTRGRVTAINQVDMEQYLLGVVPREIGKVGSELIEAAKAQAVAARTYAMRYLGRRESLGFDVFATVSDQVYGGVTDEHEPVSRAVRETAGEILVYDGEPIEAFYHSTCAGRTAAIDEVWDSPPRPYLKSVIDIDPRTGEAFDRSSSRFEWTQRWTRHQIESTLSRTLADSLPAGRSGIGELRDMRVLERTPSRRVKAMLIETDAGNFTVGGDRVRWILRTPEDAILNSSKFDIQIVRDAAGDITEVIAIGGGWGHGIGMCQVGAMGRARSGQDYRQILETYYPGSRIVNLY